MAHLSGRSVLDMIKWTLSVLAIPSLVWAWNLSIDVEIHNQDIARLNSQLNKYEKHDQELTAIKIHLANLKESINELKILLRD